MGSIFGYKTEVVMRIAIAELLAFAYNLEYLLRLTKLKYTHIFIVDFHGRRIYSAYHHKGPVISVTKLCITQSGLTQSESNFVDKLKKGCSINCHAHVDIVLTTNVIQNVRKKKRN